MKVSYANFFGILVFTIKKKIVMLPYIASDSKKAYNKDFLS